MTTKYHKSVLLEESLKYLQIRPDGFYIDCTLGEGGHSFEIIKRLNKDGFLLSIDQDEEAVHFVKNFYKTEQYSNWKIENINFEKMTSLIPTDKPQVNGILFDLGISSRQLEFHNRGFSFNAENDPLDMRMNTSLGVTAKDLINVLNIKQLSQLISSFSEERNANSIAKMIFNNKFKIETVKDLKEVISKAVPAVQRKNIDRIIRRVFQALRIAVNSELETLERSLEIAFQILSPKGRIVVITFHSLEDRIVKQFFLKESENGKGIVITQKPIGTSPEELTLNSRAHSAKLRCIEKI